jgi:hypothetical protein
MNGAKDVAWQENQAGIKPGEGVIDPNCPDPWIPWPLLPDHNTWESS